MTQPVRCSQPLLLLLLAGAVFTGCGDDNGSSGEFQCTGSECVCPGAGDCTIHCLDDCDLQCAGSGSCDFTCDVACNVACTSSGECVADVLAGSSIACTGSGNCDVTCHGDCTVDCPGSGDCLVTCLDGGVCQITHCPTDIIECSDTLQICGLGCPVD